jgi:Tol biopolymer transport system component
VVTPRNFPKQTIDDLTDMFRLDAELGSFAVLRVEWKDPNHFEAARALSALGDQRSLDAVVELNPFKMNELKAAPIDAGNGVPKGQQLSFANGVVAEAFTKTVLEMAQIRPAYLAIATDVNLHAMADRSSFDALARLYRDLYPKIKGISPKTKVFVTFQWDAMQGRSAEEGRDLIRAFGANLDLLAFTSDPRKLFERAGPNGIPDDYYARISQFRPGDAPVFLEVHWPSEGSNGDADQAAFIRALPNRLRQVNPAMLAWTFLYDAKVLIFTVRAGLINLDGRPKPGFAAFKEISNDRPAGGAKVEASEAASPRSGTSTASRDPAHFGIYTARLDGSDVQTVMTSPDREMTHPRIAPDGRRLVLTRYNNRGRDGKATEEQGYDNTEIMIVNLDGTGLETIIPAKAGVIAANGAWSPDGGSLIFLSTDNPDRKPEIKRIDLASRKITRVPTPAGLAVSDPHWVGDDLVFPVKDKAGDVLWTMKIGGGDAKQATRLESPRKPATAEPWGDFDPKLSPDGTKLAFMRAYGGTSWRVMTLDRKTGQERTLTRDSGVIEGLPTWSSDGKLLLYRHIDLKKLQETGLYTMTPDGDDRKMVPLPRGFLYNHGTFFPGAEGAAGPRARIIYTGTVDPRM